jgi:hypothetical protein
MNMMTAHDESLNLFSTKPTNKGIIQSQIIEHLPLSDPSNGCIEFNITSQSFLDLPKTKLYLKCKVVQSDGSNLKHITKSDEYDKTGDAGITNCLFGGLFYRVDINLQNQSVSNEIPNYAYPYKFMIDKLLTTKQTSDPSVLFIKDDSKGINACSLWKALDDNKDNQLGNKGLSERIKFMNKSQTFEMEGNIGVDFMHQKRLILHNCNLNIKLWQSSPEFTLLSGDASEKFKLKIIEAKLLLSHVTLNPAASVALSDAL